MSLSMKWLSSVCRRALPVCSTNKLPVSCCMFPLLAVVHCKRYRATGPHRAESTWT